MTQDNMQNINATSKHGIADNSKELPSIALTRRGYVDGPFGQIHYHHTAPEIDCKSIHPTYSKPLIMLHQAPVNARMFERAMPFLAENGITAIAIDIPGYGYSDAPFYPPTIQDYASIVAAFLDALNIKSAHFLGHHTGAAIAACFTASCPDRVTSLILNGPPLNWRQQFGEGSSFTHESDEIENDGAHLQKRWQRRVSYTEGWSDKEAMHRRVIDQLWAGHNSWYGHNASFNYDMGADFEAISVPTMILTNTGDDIYQLALNAKKQRPDMAYVELSGGTHDIVDEQPENWSAAVTQFIKQY